MIFVRAGANPLGNPTRCFSHSRGNEKKSENGSRATNPVLSFDLCSMKKRVQKHLSGHAGFKRRPLKAIDAYLIKMSTLSCYRVKPPPLPVSRRTSTTLSSHATRTIRSPSSTCQIMIGIAFRSALHIFSPDRIAARVTHRLRWDWSPR